MARNQVVGIGTAGIIKDIKPSLLPAEVWTDGRNVRFESQKCQGMGGVVAVLDTPVPTLLNCGLVAGVSQNSYIYTTTAGEVFKYYPPGPAVEITRVSGGNYLETPDNLFDIFMYNGYAFFNNGVDLPQVWNPADTNMVNLPNWDTTWRARTIRNFKGILIALAVTEDTDFYSQRMRWSHPAEAGFVPASWDATDPDFDAGIFDFSDSNTGELVTGAELGERFYIYKERAIHVLSYVGGQNIFARNLITDQVGITVPRSLASIPTTKQGVPYHFFAGDEGFYMNDGLKAQPFFREIFRNEILKIVNRDHYKTRSFSVVHPREQELWFCIPEAGADFATLAFCFNYSTNSYSIRELSGASNIASGINLDFTQYVGEGDLPFDDETLFEDSVGFNDAVTLPGKGLLLEASPTLENLFAVDTGTLDYDEEPYPRWIEKVSLAAIKNDPRNYAATIQDYSRRKMATCVIPKLYEGDCQIRVGSQESDMDDVTWGDYLPQTTRYRRDLAVPVSGRFLSFRFDSLGEEPFSIGGFDYELDILGEF